MKTVVTSLAFTSVLALSGVASADSVRCDLRFQGAFQPTLELVRGGGADRPDPFAELREKRRQQQSEKDKAHKDNARKSNAHKDKTEAGAKDQTPKSKDKSGGGFFGLFGS